MTDGIAARLTPTTVIRNGKVRAAGRRMDQVIVYDWGFEYEGRHWQQRSFVLLDDGFQINQPVIFPPERQGWWYCDLVRIVDDGAVVSVDDLWIDVIVGPPNHPYRMLDLHEYAAAMTSGALSMADAADGLARTQRFLDRRLNRRYDHAEGTWLNFPPAGVEQLMDVHFPGTGQPSMVDIRARSSGFTASDAARRVGQVAATRAVAGFPGDPVDVAALASTVGGPPLDLSA